MVHQTCMRGRCHQHAIHPPCRGGDDEGACAGLQGAGGHSAEPPLHPGCGRAGPSAGRHVLRKARPVAASSTGTFAVCCKGLPTQQRCLLRRALQPTLLPAPSMCMGDSTCVDVAAVQQCFHHLPWQALATISVEEDPRMASLDRKALARVVDFLRHPPHVDAMLPALTLATNLARTASNR